MVLNIFKLFTFGSNKTTKSQNLSNETYLTVKNEWANINLLIKQGSPSQLRQALISADKCLDSVLKGKVVGENMGERLKNAKNLFHKDIYNKIWSAHKIRNSLVHEAGYEPPHYMLIQAIEDLRNALNLIGIKV